MDYKAPLVLQFFFTAGGLSLVDSGREKAALFYFYEVPIYALSI
jgi:hypothetical protein